MTLTYELDLYWVKIKYGAEYLGQRSFRSKIIVRTQTHTHGDAHATRTTKVVGNNIVSVAIQDS